jgi:hypothetical protein
VACDVVLTLPESMKVGERLPSIFAFEESRALTWIAFAVPGCQYRLCSWLETGILATWRQSDGSCEPKEF